MENSDSIVIVKVGSSVLVRPDGGLNFNRISDLCKDMGECVKRGNRMVLITSGAVAAGKGEVKSWKGVSKKNLNHLWFSVGQPIVSTFLRDRCKENGLSTAFLLVSRSAFASREQYFSIRDTIRGLIGNGVIPVINDNDILHQEEMRFSDNDHLCAYLGGMLNARAAIFLTDRDGIYRDYPSNTDLIEVCDENPSQLEDYIGHDIVGAGSGGMKSKINSTKLLFELGIDSYIANGKNPAPISSVLLGKSPCTVIRPNTKKKISGIRKWLCTGAVPHGLIKVSRYGAEKITKIEPRGSLLAKGIIGFEGHFTKGDVVSVVDEKEKFLGYGITKFGHSDLYDVLGQEKIIVIHADYFYGISVNS